MMVYRPIMTAALLSAAHAHAPVGCK